MNDLPMSLRTTEGEQFYADQKMSNNLKALADEPSLIDYKYWRVINNRFPYNAVLAEHNLLIPRRVVAERAELNLQEVHELAEILDELKNNYDFVMENFPHKRSVLYHYHLHLGLYKDKRSDVHF